MKNFWQDLERPILCLAPLANVTDAAFRQVIAERGKPSVCYTEFVSADGLVLAPEKGRRKLLKDLEYSEIERPIVAQLFSGNPENMEKAATLVLSLGFDGVDINMGCPDKSVEKQNAGAALIKNPKLAREIIRAAKRGVEDKIPVSVKTRIGYNKDELEEWFPELLAENPAAIILHLRTRKEMSKVPVHWDRMKRAVEIRDNLKSETLILGNGDIVDTDDARTKCRESGADGAMLGRAIFGNPWLFSPKSDFGQKEKLEALLEHIKLFDEKLGNIKSFAIMKKHFKSYVSDKKLREKLMQAESAKQAIHILKLE